MKYCYYNISRPHTIIYKNVFKVHYTKKLICPILLDVPFCWLSPLPFDVNSEVWLYEVKTWLSSSSVYGPLPKIQFCIFLHNGLTWGPPEYYNLNLMQIAWLLWSIIFFPNWKEFENDAKLYRLKWNTMLILASTQGFRRGKGWYRASKI